MYGLGKLHRRLSGALEEMIAASDMPAPVRGALERIRLLLAVTVAGGKLPELIGLLLQPPRSDYQEWHLDSWANVINAIICLQDDFPQTQFLQPQDVHDPAGWVDTIPTGKWHGEPIIYDPVHFRDVLLFVSQTVHRGAANYKADTRGAMFASWPRTDEAQLDLSNNAPTCGADGGMCGLGQLPRRLSRPQMCELQST